MNACASCGATLSGGEAFCPQCGTAIATAAKPPGAWRRLATGAVALPLLGGGAFVLALSIVGLADCEEFDCFWWALLAIVVGLPLTVAGALFAVATVVPFGKTRRVAVGLGAAFLGGAAALVPSAAFVGPGAVLVGLAAAVGFFYLGYRIAR